MKVDCVGGGPASLYFAVLMKRADPSHDITVHERYPEGSTYGWGVTYWDDLYNNLHSADPESARAIGDDSVRWDTWVAHVHGHRPPSLVENWDVGFGISRSRLLAILAARARSLGVRLEYEREITSEEELTGADLIVVGDGVNSALRQRHAGHFGTEVAVGRNAYLWLGTTKVFDSFTFAFVETPHGWIWCYGYRYSNERSTCIIECSPETWAGLGFDQANEADSLALLEKLFADILDGHSLIGQDAAGESARWLNFRTLTNERWHHGNLVLIGDAAHTTHYSVGAGTALAFRDAAFLVYALHAKPRLEPALEFYERERQAEIRPMQKAARNSARWYESLPRYANLPSEQLLALLAQRHSALLPYVPPRLHYRFDQALKHAAWLWSKIASRGTPG
ncbi:FAD-dependent monooxygenase [Nonomuraea sp. 3N208]|uniref:FAD-dependent monooxygenase n=1 Tax=Nonomuraea sp. 3N208 TaxID=3457421 RepID=UPI003FD1DB58